MESTAAKKGKSDEEARAADVARTGVAGADEATPTSVTRVPTTRATSEDQARATKRTIFADDGGARRVVAAGDPIPAGWTEVEDGDVAKRDVETARSKDQPAGHGIEDKAQRGPRGR